MDRTAPSVLRAYERQAILGVIMMTDSRKAELELQLNEAIIQLQQAQKSLRKNEFIHASIFIGNAQNQLPKMRMALAKH